MDRVIPQLDNIPDQMKKLDRWCVWRHDDDGERITKMPYRAYVPVQIRAATNKLETWSDLDTAMRRFIEYDDMEGIGFLLGDGIFGIDLDGCVDPTAGEIKPWARQIVDRLGTYAEISQSGCGIKVTGLGQISRIEKSGKPLSRKHLPAEIDFFSDDHCEVAFWNRTRFWAMTGNHLTGTPDRLVECADVADAILVELGGEAAKAKPTSNYRPSENPSIILDRCIKYLQKVDPAISGQGGHGATFHAACICFRFGLPPSDAKQAMMWFNDNKCEPPWTERELDHKLEDALREVTSSNQFGDLVRSTPAPEPFASSTPEPAEPESTPESKPEPKPKLHTLEAAAEAYLAAIGNGDPLIDLGIPELSYALGGGVELGEMLIVAARPSHGKSAVMLQTMHECARAGLETLIVSEEMSTLALGKRAIQYITPVHHDNWLYQREAVSKQVKDHFRDRKPIHIVESCRTPANIERAVERYVKEHGVKVVAVDYAQMVLGSGKSRYEQVSDTSTRLKALANKHNILLIVLAQLNREIEGRNAFVPKMTDLKDAGQLEQDADCIVFLVWPHRIDSKNDPAEYQIFVAKNRNRPINCPAFTCRFEPGRQRLTDMRPANYETAFDQTDDEGLAI